MAKAIYKIKVTNWGKYNAKQKKAYKSTLISNNFCTDSKLSVLPLSHRWLFLGILLTCGNHTSDTIEMSERQVRDLLESSKSIERALASLQSLQLLTYDKIEHLYKIKEKEIKLKEIKEKDTATAFELPSPSKKVSTKKSYSETLDIQKPLATTKAWESYRDAIKTRWGDEPVRNQKVNSIIKQIVERVGEADAPEVLKFYVSHQDTWYVKNCHSVNLALTNIESLWLQWKAKINITPSKLKAFEKKNEYQEMMNQFDLEANKASGGDT